MLERRGFGILRTVRASRYYQYRLARLAQPKPGKEVSAMPTRHSSTPLRVRQLFSTLSLPLTRRLRFALLGAYLRGWLGAPALARWYRRLPGPEVRS